MARAHGDLGRGQRLLAGGAAAAVDEAFLVTKSPQEFVDDLVAHSTPDGVRHAGR